MTAVTSKIRRSTVTGKTIKILRLHSLEDDGDNCGGAFDFSACKFSELVRTQASALPSDVGLLSCADYRVGESTFVGDLCKGDHFINRANSMVPLV